MEPNEIRPGLFHWTSTHPKIGVAVSSYMLTDAGVLIDPLLPSGGLDWLRDAGPPEHVVLTNRHHWRHCSEIIAAFGCTVWCNELGLQELDGEPGRENVRGYRVGDVLPANMQAHEVGVLCPDETALRFELPSGSSCLALADGVVRIGEAARGDGPLVFVPDSLLADDPADAERVKNGLRAAYRRLCELEWDTLLLAHGLPLLGDGKELLLEFVTD